MTPQPGSLRLAASASVIASLVAAASLFAAFRISIEMTSVETVGCWAVVQSIFILARLPDMGLGINLTRLAAIRIKTRPHSSIRDLAMAGLVMSVVPVAVVGALTIPLCIWLTRTFLDISETDATPVLTFSLLACLFAVLNTAASVLLALVEGHGRIVARNIISTIAYLVFAFSMYPAIAWYGAAGIGIAYAVYAAALLGLGGLTAGRIANFGRSSSHEGVKEVVRSIWREYFNVSAMALTRVTFEPWTKLIVGMVGGLAAVAHLDLAFRISTQIRVTLQSAMQPLLFAGARQQNEMPPDLVSRFDRAGKLAVRANIIAFAAQLTAAPLLSWLGLGTLADDFVVYLVLLAGANCINSLGVIGYYWAASGGALGKVLRIHLWMMGLNFVFGGAGGWFFGPVGAIAGYALSIAYGGVALILIWLKARSGKWTSAVDRAGWLLVASVPAAIAYLLSLPLWIARPPVTVAFASAVFSIALLMPLAALLLHSPIRHLAGHLRLWRN